MPRTATGPLYPHPASDSTVFRVYCVGCQREIIALYLPVDVETLTGVIRVVRKEHRRCPVPSPEETKTILAALQSGEALPRSEERECPPNPSAPPNPPTSPTCPT